MSELIHNSNAKGLDPVRQHHLKRLIMDLHAGRSKDEVTKEFKALFGGVSSEEIAAIEATLVSEGMPVEEIQKMCDVHAAIMGTSVENIRIPAKAVDTAGHPVYQLEVENKAIETLISTQLMPAINEYARLASEPNSFKVLEALNGLADVDKHYLRKENLIFPYLEKAGITAPPKVMWGVHDEIRAMIKGAKVLVMGKRAEAVKVATEAAQKVSDMIFKERNILYPMMTNALSEDDWIKVENESDELGYCLVPPASKWNPERASVAKEDAAYSNAGKPSGSSINLGTGVLKPAQIELMLNHMPVDITFIDENDVVRYFSNSKERIFPRNKTIIGRLVQNCHPPKSMAVVEQILNDFKSGAKDNEDFWINMHGMMVYIRYFAIRDENGKYAGALEVSQEISAIRALQGEKRIMS
jgi:DUF438 domain-containing protein